MPRIPYNNTFPVRSAICSKFRIRSQLRHSLVQPTNLKLLNRPCLQLFSHRSPRSPLLRRLPRKIVILLKNQRRSSTVKRFSFRRRSFEECSLQMFPRRTRSNSVPNSERSVLRSTPVSFLRPSPIEFVGRRCFFSSRPFQHIPI